MIKYKNKKVSIQEIISITCDICKKTFKANDWTESQEFVKIRQDCGFGSVFGDTNIVEIDICQHCLKEKLGEFIRIRER